MHKYEIEYGRGQNIRLDQWVSALLSIAIICVALYAAPLLSAGLRYACFGVTVAAVLVLQPYDRRKISRLKISRDDLAALQDHWTDEPCWKATRHRRIHRAEFRGYGCRRVGQSFLGLRCGVTMPMNSRDVITLVFFQNLGKYLGLPVTR